MNHTKPKNGSFRFLLVEDDTVASIDLECILEDLGHSVTAVAATEGRAVEQLQRNASGIDAAILDHDLVGRSSLPVANDLRQRGIPCVIASELREQQLRLLGFDGLTIEKPYSANDVAMALSRLSAA